MNDLEKTKLIKFINDRDMSNAVRKFIENVIIDRKGQKDVYMLAGERIAIDVLKETWQELERYNAKDSEERIINNVGL